ncbi:MAG: hypothetical protein H6739_38445 [Alphaproteobacteria bacterium]|nr:hypothetical protein [Alphaproteobacteria bacterium]
MRYVDLIAANPLIWGLFLLYMAGTGWLAWLGHKKTSDIESFAVGKGDLHPGVVGVTLAASIASTATFIINPGFVYVHGVSALMHLGVAVFGGVMLGLFTMSVQFRRIGARAGALTIPQWVAQRYGSPGLGVLFALINLLSLSFVVLIVGGLSIVMQQTLGLSNVESLLLIIGFVFSYIFIGGTYAHAYTNTLQGLIMVVVCVVILASGLHLFGDGVGAFMDRVAAVDPNLVRGVNPESVLFSSPFTVYISGFFIGFALVCQPHIMTKALYVKTDRAVWTFLGVTFVVFGLFTALLLVGLYAHAAGMGSDLFVDPATGAFRQDLVMTIYITETFSPTMVAFITVALMAAGMSTLDGILVSLSSIAANDLFLALTKDNLLAGKDRAEQATLAYRAGQGILIGMGVLAFLIALHPPKLLGIFGQVGVYGIVAASTVPILFGILFPGVGRRVALAAALSGMITHFALYAWGSWAVDAGVDLVQVVSGLGPVALLFDESATQLGLRNPGVTATYGLIVSALVALPAGLMSRRSAEPEPTAAVV